MVSRWAHIPEIGGSNPLSATKHNQKRLDRRFNLGYGNHAYTDTAKPGVNRPFLCKNTLECSVSARTEWLYPAVSTLRGFLMGDRKMDAKTEEITKASQMISMVLEDLAQFMGYANPVESIIASEIIESISTASAKLDRLFAAISVEK